MFSINPVVIFRKSQWRIRQALHKMWWHNNAQTFAGPFSYRTSQTQFTSDALNNRVATVASSNFTESTAGVNLTAMWRGGQQRCRFVHSVATLITFLPHHVKGVLWRVANRLSYIEDTRCLKVNVASNGRFIQTGELGRMCWNGCRLFLRHCPSVFWESKKSRTKPKKIAFLGNEDVAGCVTNTLHLICSLNFHFSGLDIQLAQLQRVNGPQ